MHAPGTKSEVRGITTVQFTMDSETRYPCNETYYASWAAATGFSATAYLAAMGALTSSPRYWDLMGNATALAEFMATQSIGDLEPYFGQLDARLYRWVALVV